MRLIDADRLLDRYDRLGWDGVQAIVDMQPTIDPKDLIPKGRWIEAEKENIWGNKVKVFECTNCKKFTVGQRGIVAKFNFCPNCGADMREEDHEMP